MTTQHFWAILIGFLAGVFLRSFFSIGWIEAGFLVLLGGALVCIAAIVRTHVVVLGALLVIACAGGIVRMHEARLIGSPALNTYLGEKVVLEGRVFEEPDTRESSTRLSVQVDSLMMNDATTTIAVGVLVVAPTHVGVAYGDRVRAEGILRLPASFDAGAGREFNYPAYLARDGIGYELSFAHVEHIGEGKRNLLKAGAIWIKQKYLEGIGLALPEPQAGLAGGITAGDKRGLGSELSETFRVVGLIHIVVLSGYNIMVVIGFIERILRRAHRYTRFGLAVGVAMFFALMTGLASSSVRAALMAVIASVGKTTGRTYLASRALALVAGFMVVWNPWILAFDPGFQLSIVATWGLIFFSPYIATKLSFVTERMGLREIAAATIGTQLAVLPLLLYQSGQLSLIALPVNLLALVAVPWAMLASFVAGVFGVFAGPLAPVIAFPAYALLSYILLVAEWAAKVPFASLSIATFPLAFVVLTYLVLIIFVRRQSVSQSHSNSDS